MAVRSEQSHMAILEATMRLLDERNPGAVSVQKLSIERIAREAGVSKTTIYRWWPSKTAVIIDTFLENHIARTPIRDDIPAIDALREHVLSLAEIYSGHEGPLIAQLIGECQYDPKAMADFKERFWMDRQKASYAVVDRAMREGSIRTDVPVATVTDLLYAPIYFHLLLASGPLDEETITANFDAAMEGLRVRD